MGLDKLIDDCRKKRPKAQEELYKRYASTLFTVALKYSRDRAQAEDNLQDAFITIFEKLDQYKGKGSFEGWLKRITINTALQKYRKQETLELVNEENIQEVTVEVDEEDIQVDFLLKIIQELPDRYRLVFNLYVMDGYGHKEIAKMLKITEGTSKSNLARARMILRDKINTHDNKNLKSSTL
ncbi:MAG: RNA polymerase subunit sigma-70 [Cytophagaceae bacterium]|nr:RNA polymerase subunit sigma-70 [Cytophagaceae bacterium]